MSPKSDTPGEHISTEFVLPFRDNVKYRSEATTVSAKMVLALQDSYPSPSQNIQFASVGTAAKFPPIYLSPSDTHVTSLIHSTVHTSE